MAFPITELLDEQACYEFLLGVLPPKGLRCPTGHTVAAQHPRDVGQRGDAASRVKEQILTYAAPAALSLSYRFGKVSEELHRRLSRRKAGPPLHSWNFWCCRTCWRYSCSPL